jgi:hypothetical protein
VFFESFLIEKRHEKRIEKRAKNGQKTRRETP